jgi:hypothetical protein
LGIFESLHGKVTTFSRAGLLTQFELLFIGEEYVDCFDVGDIWIDRDQLEVDLLPFFQLEIGLFLKFYHRKVSADNIESDNQILVCVALQPKEIAGELFFRFLEKSTKIYVLLLVVNR